MWAFEAAAPICFAFQVEVGTRVKVVRGRRALGATGVVFWVGANKYGPGVRLGIHADHGKTLWIDLDHVEALGDDDTAAGDDGADDDTPDGAPPAPPTPPLDSGIDEAITAYIARREEEIPAAFE